ncbi:hypothetical protein [Pseudarcicella hirudinis]|uniref:hypothetical protein n=1 Tax=Pseudarcicella hirudinis TaxID=1079859 RepID=UPI0015A629D8|nr:hypothetical protein [Pseudarcicella hirudinis]
MKRKLLIFSGYLAVGILFYRILTNGVSLIDLVLCLAIYIICIVSLITLKP